MKKNVLILLGLFCLVGLSSCDDKPKPNDDIVIPPPINGSVWIVNEGNFQSGNASLTVLDYGENKLYDDVFESTNHRKLGDVFQSVNVINDRAYCVVNNSAKIEVVNAENYQSIATITGFVSPRYILQVDQGKAYVTEYYSNRICIVDLNANLLVDSIHLDGWGEEMAIVNQKVYVTNPRTNYVYVINAINNMIMDSIGVVKGGVSIQLDAQQKLWVLSKGDALSNIKPALQRINPTADTVEQTFTLTSAEGDVSRLRMNSGRTTMYWLGKHVFRHHIADATPSNTAFITSVNQNFYGLGVHPISHEIYVSDAKDFVQRSDINRYHADGSLSAFFKAGIIASDFYFYYP